jgi:hypothetical protein
VALQGKIQVQQLNFIYVKRASHAGQSAISIGPSITCGHIATALITSEHIIMNNQRLSPEYTCTHIRPQLKEMSSRLRLQGFLLLVVLLLVAINPNAQTLVWEELCDEPNGATSGMASGPQGTPWLMTGHSNSGFLQVNGVADRFQGTDLDEVETWQTGPINISGYPSISITMKIGELGDLEASDQIFCQYSLNGSSWTSLSNGAFADDFTMASPYASGISGSDLYLRVRAINDAIDETYWIDQIQVFSMDCSNTPVFLPYYESFESAGPVMTFVTDQPNINGLCNWAFNEVQSNGRLQLNVGAAHSGY